MEMKGQVLAVTQLIVSQETLPNNRTFKQFSQVLWMTHLVAFWSLSQFSAHRNPIFNSIVSLSEGFSQLMARATDVSEVRIAKEGSMPGYTGHVPGVKNHVVGHSFSDASRRGVAINDSLRNHEYARAIHLSTENRPANQEQDFHAELSKPGEKMDPRALLWRGSVKEAPPETRLVSGKVDLNSLRQRIGTTDGHAKPSTQMHMALGDLPYKDCRLQLKKEWCNRGPEFYEVNEGQHQVPGYTGHTHAAQHMFAKSFGKTTRELRSFPAEPSTSGKYMRYAENRPLMINEFELTRPMRYPHNQLLETGEGTLGPLPDGAGPLYTPKGASRGGDCSE